jgi:hypothetical protein
MIDTSKIIWTEYQDFSWTGILRIPQPLGASNYKYDYIHTIEFSIGAPRHAYNGVCDHAVYACNSYLVYSIEFENIVTNKGNRMLLVSKGLSEFHGEPSVRHALVKRTIQALEHMTKMLLKSPQEVINRVAKPID